MNPSAVYMKTPKGLEEIAKRTFRLAPRLRTLLILVDGRSSSAELAEKAASLGGIAPMLAELAAQGFITAAGAPVAASVAAATPGATQAPGGISRSLDDARRHAIDQILSYLGPGGDMLTERLEKAQTRDALIAECERCRQALRAMAGAQKADRFWEGVSARLP